MCRECCTKCVPTIQQVRKGNQVKILSDPVTVFGESVFKIPLHNPIIHVRRGRQALVSVSQETCLVYEMSFRARLNIQQMEWMAHFILRNVGLWVIAAIFLFMWNLMQNARIYDWCICVILHIHRIWMAHQSSNDNDPSGRRFLNILPPGGVIIINTSYASSSAMR